MEQDRQELVVVGLSASQSSPGNYTLVVEDVVSRRRTPIVIGLSEAQSIAIYMEQMRPARPLVHDLYVETMASLNARLREVEIYHMHEGIFFTRLVLISSLGEVKTVEARFSDAIGIALRMQAPIYALPAVMEDASFWSQVFLPNSRKGSLSQYSLAELEELLQRLLHKEDYESASRIRTMIDHRKSQGISS